MPRHQSHELAEGAHASHPLVLGEEVLQGEGALLHSLREGLHVLVGQFLFRLLDEGEHIAHAQDAGGEAVRVERLQGVDFLAGTHQLDGNAGHRANGEGRPAAGVAVQLGEDEAGQAHGPVELLGGVHRLLPGHGVRHQEDLAGVQHVLEVCQLSELLRVKLHVAHRVHQDHGCPSALGLFQARLADLYRAGIAVLGEHRDVDLLPQGDELFDGRYALGIGGHHEGVFALAAQVQGELGRGGGLAGALQPHQHHHRGRRLGVLQPGLPSAQHLHQLLVHHVDDLLHGREAGEHLGAQRPLLHPLDKLADDLEVDVRLQQSQPHLAQRLVQDALGDGAAAAQAAKYALKLVGKGFEHSYGKDCIGSSLRASRKAGRAA